MIDVHKVFAPAFYYGGRWWARASAQIYNDVSGRLAHLRLAVSHFSNVAIRF